MRDCAYGNAETKMCASAFAGAADTSGAGEKLERLAGVRDYARTRRDNASV